jgi:molybdate transport system substrate-binding protein
VALFTGIIALNARRAGDGGMGLMVYCAVVMKEPMEQIIGQYEMDHGIAVRVQYGGSGTLLTSLRIVQQGDLYLSADASYMDQAQALGVVTETAPLAYVRPVIAVPRGNPMDIHSVDDLLRPDVRIALANADTASIGRQSKALLEKQGKWVVAEEAIRGRGVFKPTVNEVANDVKLGTVDAAMVWDATVHLYPDLERVDIAGAEEFIHTVTIGRLSYAANAEGADAFMAYLLGEGSAFMREAGLSLVEPRAPAS